MVYGQVEMTGHRWYRIFYISAGNYKQG